MDRFIPCRMGENLQAKFEAVSQKQEEEYKYNIAGGDIALNVEESAADNDMNRSQNPMPNGQSEIQGRGFSNILGGISTID